MLPEVPFPLLAVLHAAPTLYLCGLIWFVQVVHYPLYAEVGAERFAEYEREHCRRTNRVVLVPMLLELSLAAWLLVAAPAHLRAWTATGMLLVVVVWGSTFLLQVPCHRRLARGQDFGAIRRIVATNWLRTAAWTARAALALWLLVA